MKKLLVFALILILALSFLTACGNGNGNDNDNDIRVRTSDDVDDDADSRASNDSADIQEQPDTPDDSNDLIVGTWVYTMDFSSFLQEELGAEFADLGEDFAGLFDDLGRNAMLTILFEFNEDGTFRTYADEDSVYTMINAIIESIVPALDYFIDAVYEELAEAAADLGMSVEDLIAIFEEDVGMSFSDYVDEVMEEMLSEIGDLEVLFEDLTDSGRYKIEGDRLFIASDGEEFDHYDVFEVSENTLTLLSTSDPDFDPNEFGGLFSYPIQFTRR